MFPGVGFYTLRKNVDNVKNYAYDLNVLVGICGLCMLSSLSMHWENSRTRGMKKYNAGYNTMII